MNVAVSTTLELAANSTSLTASFRTERGRLYTVMAVNALPGGTVRVRYLHDGGVVMQDQTVSAPNPAIIAVASDLAGTIEVTYNYTADPAIRRLPLIVVKEITV